MSCCGEKRTNWQQYRRISHQAAAPVSDYSGDLHPQTPPLQNPQLLRYHHQGSLLMRGPKTGITYLFAGDGDGLPVDERDVTDLLATGALAMADNSASS